MSIRAAVRSWFARWRPGSNDKHQSGWDNPANGTDLLATMLAAQRRRKKPLP